MIPVYLAAPFAPNPTLGLTTEENLRRVNLFMDLALDRGYAPMCVHHTVHAGAYGNDNVPRERERGFQVSIALAVSLLRAGGQLWVLQNPDHSLSSGVNQEVLAVTPSYSRRIRIFWLRPDDTFEEHP